MMRIFSLVAIVCSIVWVAPIFAAQDAGGKPPTDWGFGKPFAYIIWDGHRFGLTPQDQERDLRYFKDLGFTHSLIDVELGELKPKATELRKTLFGMFQKYDMIAGLRYGWRFENLTKPWDEMTAAGMTLRATNKEKNNPSPILNPIHSDVIDFYANGVLQSYNACRALDADGRIKFFLIGSEYTFALPEKEKCPAAAVEVILKAAREDGAIGANEDDWTKLQAWWTGPTTHGRDWRIRKAIADGVHKTTPDAMFMIDPIWCVKLVDGGFGGHWSYINKGMVLGMPDEAVRIMGQCWPYPATHSTQLIQGAHHDTILEGNLMCLCVGIPSLYHWGINTFEPGRGENPYYRYKGEKSPQVEASLRVDIAAQRRDKEPALRATGRFIRERGQMLHDWKPMEPRVAYVAGLYGPADPQLAMLTGQIPFDLLRNKSHREAELAKYKFALVGENKKPLDPDDYERLLKIEASGGAVLVPKGFTPPAGAKALAKPYEWDPEVVGESIRASKGITYPAGYAALQEHNKKGAAHLREVLGRAGFKPYFDIQNTDVVSRPYTYKEHAMLFVVNDKRVAGTETFKEQPDVAEPDANGVTPPAKPAKAKPDAGPRPANTGVPEDIEVFVRDASAGLKVIDIDTGRELKLEACPDGQKFKDTIPGAWYRIYAVVKPGQTYQGPPPLKPAPAIAKFSATRATTGVKLEWKTDVQDWVGSDVQTFRVYRGERDQAPKFIKEIYGRIVEGGGGIVESFVDTEAKAGTAYTYQIQAVSPLRVAGPISAAAKTP